MSDNKQKHFVSFIDEEGNTKSGYFEILSETENWITIASDDNEIKIPQHKVLKIKKRRSKI